jgi:hypothetical protein
MKPIALAFTLAVAGCAHAQTTSKVHSPYERYLPQAPPSETNRFESPAGYSIVSPLGWKAQIGSPEDWMKDNIVDDIVIEGQTSDKWCPTSITVDHLGPGEYRLYDGWLHSTQSLPDGWAHTEFQGQPALKKFYEGSGSREATRGSYQPWLMQELFLERNGQGFILTFIVKNADRHPYFMQPLPIVEQYFETFRYEPPKK